MRHTRFLEKHRRGRTDYVIIACALLLIVFGLVMLASASSHLGEARFGNSYHFLIRQVLYGVIPGAIGFLAAFIVPYYWYRRLALPVFLASIVLVTLTMTSLGVAVKGASRWLAIGPITFQPSEFLKITFVLYLAAWLGGSAFRRKTFFQGFLPFLLTCGALSIVLLIQRSTSIVVILVATALVVYFVSGARVRYVLGVAAVGALTLALVIYLTPYRLKRVVTFLNPETADTQSVGYHLNQALIAIGSGGLFGVGYGQSTTKISYLPEPIGDSIFAVIGEETGFVGAALLTLVFLALVLRILFRARRTRDGFGQLILIGFGTLIALQAFVNIGAISGIIPLTGAPLPFVSYGGTALATFMTIIGIVVNVTKYA